MDPVNALDVPSTGAAVAGERITVPKEPSSKHPSSGHPSSDSEHLACEQSSEAPSSEVPSDETLSTEPPAKEHTYKFNVNMSCGGCSGAVTRALEKAQKNNAGISSFDVNLDKKEVIVKGAIAYEALHETIKKTGKTVHSGEIVE